MVQETGTSTLRALHVVCDVGQILVRRTQHPLIVRSLLLWHRHPQNVSFMSLFITVVVVVAVVVPRSRRGQQGGLEGRRPVAKVWQQRED